jgi:hypothetical protein
MKLPTGPQSYRAPALHCVCNLTPPAICFCNFRQTEEGWAWLEESPENLSSFLARFAHISSATIAKRKAYQHQAYSRKRWQPNGKLAPVVFVPTLATVEEDPDEIAHGFGARMWNTGLGRWL